MITGAQSRAWGDRRFLLIAASEGDPAQEAAALDQMLEHRVEGLLYATTWHRAVTLPTAAREVPTVLVNCYDADGELPCILPDEVSGGYKATHAAPGRRSHPHRVHQPRPGDPGRHRQARRVRTCPARGRDHPDPSLVVPGWATADSAYTAACDLLDRPASDRPTALFCGNDRMAMGAYDAIKERGLRIPHDVAVVGFDNQELIAAYLRPKLTTLALPFEAMGTKGIDMLAALAAGQPLDTRQVTIDCPLLERSSV